MPQRRKPSSHCPAMTAVIAILLVAVTWGSADAAQPTADATPTPAPDTGALAAQLAAELGIAQINETNGVVVQALRPLVTGQPLWSAHTYGPMPDHVIAIYTLIAGNWLELDRETLKCSNFVNSDSVRQVDVAPGRIWLEVYSFAGVHTFCYDLLSFDGRILRVEADNVNVIPGLTGLHDLNGDGVLEVILDHSEAFVFFPYTIGVVDPEVHVLRWNGEHFREIELTLLPESAPNAVRDANNHAIWLARARIWQAAAEQAQVALDLAPGDETVWWNRVLIHINLDSASGGQVPLCDEVMRGDYAAIIARMRRYPVQELFDARTGPLAEVDENWQQDYLNCCVYRANQALEYFPDYAVARFVRGWALYHRDPSDPEAGREVLRAAELQPDDPLFVASAALLMERQP